MQGDEEARNVLIERNLRLVAHICKKYNVSLEEIATMGDSPNDICMLNNIKHSFAMNKGDYDVKKSASYTVDSVKDAIDIIKKINRAKK